MVGWCHLNKNVCVVFLSVVLSYTFALANSYAGDSNIEYETESASSDEEPSNLSLILAEILRKSSQASPISSVESRDSFPDLRGDRMISKRTRYYRKYPGKRQNRHYSDLYDCNPSPTETVRLLHAIHQARLGDIDHIVFCNRLRNPNRIIPNPRYVGKRSWN